MSSTASALPPNPPPTSGATTRTWSSARARAAASAPSCPGAGSGSRGRSSADRRHPTARAVAARLDRARGQSLAHDRAGADDARSRRTDARRGCAEASARHTFVPTSSNSSVSSRAASSMSVTAWQRLVVDVDQLGGVDRRLAALGEHDRDDVAGEPRPSQRRSAAGTCCSSIPTNGGAGFGRQRQISAAVNTCTPGSPAAAERRPR